MGRARKAIAVSLHPVSALMSSIHSRSAWCCRRHELHNAVDNPSQAEKLRAKHIKILRGCISQYLGSAQKALGPTVLQTGAASMQELHTLAGKQRVPLWTRGEVDGPAGEWRPSCAGAAMAGATDMATGSRGKRQHSLDSQLDELGACRSKLRAVVGDDPLADMAVDAAEVLDRSILPCANAAYCCLCARQGQARKHSQMQRDNTVRGPNTLQKPALLLQARQERPCQSLESPSSPASQASAAALGATAPDVDFGIKTTKDEPEGRQAAFERDMQAIGRGKWAQILEAGKHTFQGRSQVDLKDKWRNLVKYHNVPPDGEASDHGDGQQAAEGDPIDTD
eukprot:jgi/Astpho2/417/Aster-03467